MYECVKKLANIPIEITRSQEGKLPNKYGFLEMYDVGKVEQLNSLSRWEKNNPILTLQAPVGIGKSGEKLTLDLHEKFHGPHGLIAGMTVVVNLNLLLHIFYQWQSITTQMRFSSF